MEWVADVVTMLGSTFDMSLVCTPVYETSVRSVCPLSP